MYKDCSIPAKLFFKIIETKDFSLIGEGTPEEQKNAFDSVFDDYFLKEDDQRSKNIFSKRLKISAIETEIQIIKDSINLVLNTPFNDAYREKVLSILETNLGVKIDLEKDINQQLNTFKDKRLAKLNHSLVITENDLKNLTKKGKGNNATFDEMVAGIESVLGKDFIPDTISLDRFIAYKKQQKAKIKQQSNGRVRN